MLWDNKPLNILVEKIYDDIAEIIKSIKNKGSDYAISNDIKKLKEIAVAIQEKYDSDHAYDEFIFILKFLDILQYSVNSQEIWEN